MKRKWRSYQYNGRRALVFSHLISPGPLIALHSLFHVRSNIHYILERDLSQDEEKSKTCTRKRVIRALRNFELRKNFALIEIRMKLDTLKRLGSITLRKKCTSGVTLRPTPLSTYQWRIYVEAKWAIALPKPKTCRQAYLFALPKSTTWILIKTGF